MTRIFKAALYIPAYHTEGKKNPRHPCHPCLKDYLHAEGEPCSSATLVNYHLCTNLFLSVTQFFFAISDELVYFFAELLQFPACLVA